MSVRGRHLGLLWSALVVLCACKSELTPTQVIVLVEADTAVRDQTAALRIEVDSEDDAKHVVDQTLKKPKWPVAVALAPKDGDADRTYRVTAEALDTDGAVVAAARVISGYVRGERRYVVLEIEGDCIGRTPACQADETCHAGQCLEAHVDAEDFGQSRAHPGLVADHLEPIDAGAGSDSGESDAGLDAGANIGIAQPGDACDQARARACSAHASKVTLVCRDGSWEVDDACDNDQRCDSAEGITRGHCLPIADECTDQKPEQAFCADDVLRVCADLVSFIDEPCQANATCEMAAKGARCACDDGFVAEGAKCVDIDECKDDHGGCDSAAKCTNTSGSHACGACPNGYTGEGDDACTPSLIDLMVEPGEPSEDFDPDVHDYALELPIGVQRVQLKPLAPDGTQIFIGDDEVDSGDTWTSPVLAIGTQRFEIELRHDAQRVRYTLEVARGQRVDYLKASNTGGSDQFGWSAAMSGDTLVIGAPFEDSAAKGVDDEVVGQDDNNAMDSGAAYVFVREHGRWKQQAYLKASNTDAGDQFGLAVAIDGDTIVVGAAGEASSYRGVNPPNGQEDDSQTYAGAAYVFVRSDGVWRQRAYLKASNAETNDNFGLSVAVSGDTIVVGGLLESSAYRGVNATMTDQDDNSASGAGAVYVFTGSDDSWTQQAYLKASNVEANDNFGGAVAISGDTLVACAAGEDSSTSMPQSTTTGSNNDSAESGAAYVFVRSAGVWHEQAYLKAVNPESSDQFGQRAAIAGDTIVVTALYEDSASTEVNDLTPGPMDNSADASGAAYVFERSGSSWEQTAYLKASNTEAGDSFGYAVAMSADTIVVGAPFEASAGRGVDNADPGPDDNNASISGAAYLYTRDRVGGSWRFEAYLKSPNSESGDEFGYSVATDDGLVVIGSYGEDSAQKGVNGTSPGPGDNSMTNASAAYAY